MSVVCTDGRSTWPEVIDCKFCGKPCKSRDRKDEIGEFQIAFCSGCGGAAIVDDNGEVYWYTKEIIAAAVRLVHGMGYNPERDWWR